MKVKADIRFHNKFRIEKINAKSMELKKTGYAENIILDRAFDRVCQFETYFSYIHYGEGTGNLNTSKTTLFSSVGYKSAVTVSSENAYPVSQVTKMIELGTQDNNGKTLRELAISETTNAINTHALIRDAEGAPLSIPKTQDDIIRIYATVFVEFVHPGENFKFIFPNNAIADYFIKHTSMNRSIYLCGSKSMIVYFKPFNSRGSKNSTNINGDKDNRKHIKKCRFLLADGNNGNSVRRILLESTLNILLPIHEIFQGMQMDDILIGIGDGVKDTFYMPHSNVVNPQIYINDSECNNFVYEEGIIQNDVYSLSDFLSPNINWTDNNLTYELHQTVLCNPTSSSISYDDPKVFIYKFKEATTLNGFELMLVSWAGNTANCKIIVALSNDLTNWTTVVNASKKFSDTLPGESYGIINNLTPYDYIRISIEATTYPRSISVRNIYLKPKTNENTIKFNFPPDAGDIIKANYFLPYIPKDENHELEVEFEINFSEGV